MKRFLFLLLIALSLVLIFFAISEVPDAPVIEPDTPDVPVYTGKVAVILPDTGQDTNISHQVKNGIVIAAQTLDPKNLPEIQYYTITESLSLSDAALSEFIAVITVTGSVSRIWDKEKSSYKGMRMALAAPGYAEESPNDVVTFSTPPFYEVSSLRSLFDEHDIIAVFGPETTYTNQYIHALSSQSSGRVVSSTYTDESYRASLLKALLAENPKLLIITGGDYVPELARMAREFGLTGPVLVSSWSSDDPNISKDPRMEGVYTALRISDTENHPFSRLYENRFGTEASVYAAEGYDALITLSRLIPSSYGSSSYVLGWYMGKTYSGAAGSYIFDTDGTARVLMQIAQIHSGEIEPVTTYVRPPEEIVIGVYGNDEVVRGAKAAAEFVNSANTLNLPGASFSGISGLYGAKIRILQLTDDVPSEIDAVIGDLSVLDSKIMRVPLVQTVSTLSHNHLKTISFSPNETAGVDEYLSYFDKRRSFERPYTVVVLTSDELSDELISVIRGHSYEPLIISYQNLSEEKIISSLTEMEVERPIIISMQKSGADLLKLHSLVVDAGLSLEGWYVLGDTVLGDPKSVQNSLIYENFVAGDIWSNDLLSLNPLSKEVSAYYSKVNSGHTMTGVSARSFMAVVMLADAFNIAGSTDYDAVSSALTSLVYDRYETIFFGDEIRFDSSGDLVDTPTRLLQIRTDNARVVGLGTMYLPGVN